MSDFLSIIAARNFIEKIFNKSFSHPKITISLVLVVLILVSLDYIFFLIFPSWRPPVEFLGTTFAQNVPWQVELIAIAVKSVFYLVASFVLSGLIYGVFWILKKEVPYYRILLFLVIILVFIILLKVFNFGLLYGRTFVPVIAPYTFYLYLAGLIYTYYLSIVTFEIATDSRVLKIVLIFTAVLGAMIGLNLLI